LSELELGGRLPLLEDEGWLCSRILVIQILLILGCKVLYTALKAPCELEEGASSMEQGKACVIGRAELCEVDAGSNFDGIGILNDNSLHSDSDGRDIG